jgi:diguanylate cyclase (GGDEF)-like protein
VLSLSLGILALCLGSGIAFIIIRSIARPLAEVLHAAQQLCRTDVVNLASGLVALARGDLTVTAQTGSIAPLYHSRDEIGQTADAMRSIVVNVQRTVDGYEVARLELQQLYGQLAAQNKTLQSLSTTDPLTGLPNHRTVMSRVEEELSRCRRTQTSCAVLFVDLDHFKRISDTWGHQAGDAILREAGRRLSGCLRLEDFVGRYGGEEFVIVLTHTEQGEAQQVAERIRAALAEMPCLWQAEETSTAIAIPITASIGVAVFQEHGSTREALLEAADNAMYFAKHTGRNRVCLAGEEMTVMQEVLAKTGDGQMSDDIAVQALGAAAHVHDRGTSIHARRMVHLAEATARMLGRPTGELHLIRLSALLHDIGKIGIPAAILNKPGPLT